MYKLVEKKEGISSFYINDKYIVHIEKIRKGKIEIENHCNKTLFVSEQELINQFSIVGDILLYSSYNEDFTRIYNLNSNKEIVLDVYFYGVQLFSPYIYDNFYYNLSEYDNNFIYDLQTGKVVFRCMNKIQGIIQLNDNKCIVTKKDTHIYTYQKSEIFLLWQKNIRDFFNKEDSKDNQLQIKEIYAYKDNFIVVSTFGILSLNQQDGSLIWKTESYARTMEIVGNFGYVCTSICLYRINLDNGEMYDYGREYARLPDFEYEGKSYWASGHRVVFHDGLLWYLVYASGDSFVIAIDPENAEYQWIHKIDTYEKADEIQFHQDKMFVSDSGGNLFIYEKEI